MGYISSIFVDKLALLLAPGSAVRRSAVFRALTAQSRGEMDPSRLVQDTVFLDLLETIACNDEDGRSIAVRLGASMRCDDYGAFGLSFKSATDLLNAFQRVERYGRVVTSVANYTVAPGDGSTFMAVRQGAARLGEWMATELAVAAGAAISREVSSRAFQPLAVHFAHAPPADLSAFDAHFRCPIHFHSDRNGFAIADEALRAGNRLGDAGISDFFDAHLDKALTVLPVEAALAPKVRAEIARSLSDGAPGLADTARRLGVGARTMQRRLADEGVAYQDLVEETRHSLALRLLGETDFALAEIAFLTGYAEQSTFARAFKRRCGETPAGYRRNRAPA